MGRTVQTQRRSLDVWEQKKIIQEKTSRVSKTRPKRWPKCGHIKGRDIHGFIEKLKEKNFVVNGVRIYAKRVEYEVLFLDSFLSEWLDKPILFQHEDKALDYFLTEPCPFKTREGINLWNEETCFWLFEDVWASHRS